MAVLNTRILKFIIYIFLFIGFSLSAQNNDLTEIYKQQTENSNISFNRKITILDSLLKKPSIKTNDLELAQIYYNLSVEDWKLNLKRSILFANKALKIANKTTKYDDEVFVKTLYNKVLFLFRDKQLYKALSTSEEYINFYHIKDKRLGKLYRLRGNIFSDIGDIQKAIDNYDESIFIFIDINNCRELVKSYISKLETYVSLEDRLYSKDVLQIKNNLENELHQCDIKYLDEIAINLNLGTFYKYTNDIDKSFEYYFEALAISKANNDLSGIPDHLNNLAVLEKRRENYSKAKNLLFQSLNSYTINYEVKSMISNNLADIYQKEGNHEKAVVHYQKAITQALELPNLPFAELPSVKIIELSPDKLDVLGYLIDKANGWIAFYEAEKNDQYLQHALETFTLADQVIDLVFVESREDLSKLFWRKKSASFYPKAVEVCYRLQQPEKAFFFMEKNKAMLLLENMTNAVAKRLSKLPQKTIVREQELLKKIKTLETKIQTITSENSNKAVLKNELFQYKNEYNNFIDSLEIEFPKYHSYKKNVQIVTLQNIQKNMNNDELILQYILGKEKGFVAQITNKKILLQQLPATDSLTVLINRYKDAISKPFVNKNDEKNYQKIAKKLFEILIPSQKDNVKLPEKKITIIPDGPLQFIPFEALLTPDDTYLLEKAEIHYLFSLSSVKQSQKNNVHIEKDFIAVAPTKFKNNQFGTLATGTEELEKLAAIFDAEYVQYENATKETFTKAYGNYKIVHLSTHGGIENTIPWMAFYDEKLTLDELYFSKNQSELVVLSACETSDGALKKGEGVMSLARGFFNAGAKSVVSSLWEINERATQEIIQEFYKNIASGDTKSAALQKAKLTYLKRTKHTSEASPYYWSGLTITGDISPLETKRNNYKYYIFGSVMLVLLIGYLKFSKKKKAA